ncbi:MAG: hypothetical protein DRG78_04680 [Epsilonproteobacteria bacterium]|nr:MAG: hypothetical protein DRG78_04680 [Campylobacterota bacterium]
MKNININKMDMICQFFKITQKTWFNWKKEDRPIVNFTEKYLDKNLLSEFIKTNTIESFDNLKQDLHKFKYAVLYKYRINALFLVYFIEKSEIKNSDILRKKISSKEFSEILSQASSLLYENYLSIKKLVIFGQIGNDDIFDSYFFPNYFEMFELLNNMTEKESNYLIDNSNDIKKELLNFYSDYHLGTLSCINIIFSRVIIKKDILKKIKLDLTIDQQYVLMGEHAKIIQCDSLFLEELKSLNDFEKILHFLENNKSSYIELDSRKDDYDIFETINLKESFKKYQINLH